MPASSDLLKVLAEDPKSLEQQFGCMTGIFQIFDRHQTFIGRRYGSKRVSNASGNSQPTSACETPRHDRSNLYWMFEDDSSRRISADSLDRPRNGGVEATREHHRAFSDSSEIFTKSYETPTGSRTSSDQRSHLDQSPLYSEESMVGLEYYYNDQLRESSSADAVEQSELSVTECNNANVVLPGRVKLTVKPNNKDTQQSSSDIRDIVRASFDRERPREYGAKEKPRLSVDGSQSQAYLKNLPRSSSVDGKDRLRLSVDGRLDVGLRQPADLPRSTSVDGRGASRLLTDWKDGLRNSGGSPRLTIKEKDLLKHSIEGGRDLPRISVDRNVKKYQIASDGRDATRLTVDLREGPRLSVSVDDRRADGKISARPVSRLRDSSGSPNTALDFKESLRVADIKDFLRGPQKGREGPRFSVDGTRDAPRASVAPRLSVDGRDSAPSSHVPRRLKLDDRDLLRTSSKESNQSFICQQQSVGRQSTEYDVPRRVSNVVARLMGLDELPSSGQLTLPTNVPEIGLEETNLLQGLLPYHPHVGSSPPPPPDDYNYVHRCCDHEELQAQCRLLPGRDWHRGKSLRVQKNEDGFEPQDLRDQGIWYDEVSTGDHSKVQPRFPSQNQLFGKIHPSYTRHGIQHAVSQQLQKPLKKPLEDVIDTLKQSTADKRQFSQPQCDDLDQKEPQLPRAPGRRSLWHIFEAMQLKGLLNGSRRKHGDALKLNNIKVIGEKEQELKDGSQISLSREPLTAPKAYIGLHKPETPGVSVPLYHTSVDRKAQEQQGSGLAKKSKHADGEAIVVREEEMPITVVKPTLIRSTSRSQATPNQPSILSTVSDKADGPEMHIAEAANAASNRASTKSANLRADAIEMPLHSQLLVNLEPLRVTGSSNLDTSSCSNLKQSRKERLAACQIKSFSDVQQSGRESSPRGPRLTTHSQEKARSCSPRDSTSISPRCAGSLGTIRATDTNKARKKTLDREETKATLANLRANATKQDFLKARASGDPDTPPPRRSSSDSRILSKIAEKPIDIQVTKSPGTRAPSNLRSKRPVSKDSRSTLKPRPANTLGLKAVAKISLATQRDVLETVQTSHVYKQTSMCAAVSESPTTSMHDRVTVQEQQFVGSKEVNVSSRCSMSEVRVTQGGALEHSEHTTVNVRVPSGITNGHRTKSQAQETTLDIDEGVRTPRGVSVKKITFLEDEQAEAVEQPSPVSVLDNSHFDDELTPSPKAGKSSAGSLQANSENERRWSSARLLDHDLKEATLTAPLKVPDVSGLVNNTHSRTAGVVVETNTDLDKCNTELQVLLTKTRESNGHDNRIRVCFEDADKERAYVKDLLVAAGFVNGSNFPSGLWSSTGYMMDPRIIDQFEVNRRRLSFLHEVKNGKNLAGKRHIETTGRDVLDRRVLFDCVNEILDRLLETHISPMSLTGLQKPKLGKRPIGQQLLQEVLNELEDIPCAASEDVCDTVYIILQKDLVKGRGQQWSSYNKEFELIGTEVEKMIVKDLIEETLRDLSACQAQPPQLPEPTFRRQLFA